MLLEALKAQAQRKKELPDFHSLQEVRYAIDIDMHGVPTTGEVRELSNPNKPNRGIDIPIPYVSRTRNVLPLPLDRGDYVLGIPLGKTETQDAKAENRSKALHAAYLTLLEEAAEQTGHPAVVAARRFAQDVDPGKLKFPDRFDASRFIAIYVNGKLLAHEPAFQAWWIAKCGGNPGAVLDRICGVCGSPCSPVESVPVPVRGLTGIGGKATMALVSGNFDIFERHGMTRATGASICLDCGNATHQMLNQLIASDKNSFSYGSGMFIWWSIEEVDDIIGALWNGDMEHDVRNALQSILKGGRPDINLESAFLGVTLGANSNRVIVRTWLDFTLREALHNVDRWFSRISVIGRDGITARHPNVFTLLASIAPPGQGLPLSRLRPDIVDSTIKAALNNRDLPPIILIQTLGRLRATGGEIKSPMAALLKACITSVNSSHPEAFMKSLDQTSTDEAYLCGRLLALLDNASWLAIGGSNSIVDRSYSATSTMPQMNLTRLLRLHRAHLEKLKRDRPAAAFRINDSVLSVMAELKSFPKTLSVEGQARFALGLYHQQAAGRAAIQKAKEAGTLEKLSTTIQEEGEESN